MTDYKKHQFDCNPSKCDNLDCYLIDLKRRCKKCKWVRPDCEFDEEENDRICDDCRLAMIKG